MKKTTPRYISIKLPKTGGEKKNLKNIENGHIMYRGKKYKNYSNFLCRDHAIQWFSIMKVLGKNCPPRTLYPGKKKLSEIKTK